jgi:membrane protein DedA with SNARE-associated domain
MDFLQTIDTYFVRYGYLAVFVGVMLENAGIPVPGETRHYRV